MPARPRGGLRFTASVDLVMVPVIVTDRRGNYVTDIERNRFEVLEDGLPQDVIYFEAASDRSSLDLAVAIDISASMTRTMPALKQSVQALIRGLRADDTGDDLLEPSGFTSLYDAIGRSLTLLDDGSARRAVLAFTDGDDRSSFSSLESVERRVENAGAPLYALRASARRCRRSSGSYGAWRQYAAAKSSAQTAPTVWTARSARSARTFATDTSWVIPRRMPARGSALAAERRSERSACGSGTAAITNSGPARAIDADGRYGIATGAPASDNAEIR